MKSAKLLDNLEQKLAELETLREAVREHIDIVSDIRFQNINSSISVEHIYVSALELRQFISNKKKEN